MVRVLANGRQNFRMICVRAIPTDLPEEAATMGAVLQRRAVATESVSILIAGEWSWVFWVAALNWGSCSVSLVRWKAHAGWTLRLPY